MQFHNPFNKFFFFIICTSLCGQRSAKKPTSIACWTATLFTLKGYNVPRRKKLSKKGFTIWPLRGEKLPFNVLFLAHLLPTYYSISYVTYYFASEKRIPEK